MCLLNTYTCTIIRKRVWRKKEKEEKEVMQDERGGVPRGEKRLVGEEDDGGSRRDHAALSSINLSAAVV